MVQFVEQHDRRGGVGARWSERKLLQFELASGRIPGPFDSARQRTHPLKDTWTMQWAGQADWPHHWMIANVGGRRSRHAWCASEGGGDTWRGMSRWIGLKQRVQVYAGMCGLPDPGVWIFLDRGALEFFFIDRACRDCVCSENYVSSIPDDMAGGDVQHDAVRYCSRMQQGDRSSRMSRDTETSVMELIISAGSAIPEHSSTIRSDR